jgi:hypothetical protein
MTSICMFPKLRFSHCCSQIRISVCSACMRRLSSAVNALYASIHGVMSPFMMEMKLAWHVAMSWLKSSDGTSVGGTTGGGCAVACRIQSSVGRFAIVEVLMVKKVKFLFRIYCDAIANALVMPNRLQWIWLRGFILK